MKEVMVSEKNGRINGLKVLMVRMNCWSEMIWKYGERWSEVGILNLRSEGCCNY